VNASDRYSIVDGNTRHSNDGLMMRGKSNVNSCEVILIGIGDATDKREIGQPPGGRVIVAS
jgi:hypothetical protein